MNSDVHWIKKQVLTEVAQSDVNPAGYEPGTGAGTYRFHACVRKESRLPQEMLSAQERAVNQAALFPQILHLLPFTNNREALPVHQHLGRPGSRIVVGRKGKTVGACGHHREEIAAP